MRQRCLIFLMLVSSPLLAGLLPDNASNRGSKPLNVLNEEVKFGAIKKTPFNRASHKGAKKTHVEKLEKCQLCHQKKAYENNPFLPILQGQNSAYLTSKIELFKNNKRSFHPFNHFFKALSSSDIKAITEFYTNEKSPLSADLLIKNMTISDGQTIHSIQTCLACHGNDGNGDELIPAISGQNIRYLAYRIREINNNSSTIHVGQNLDVNCQIKRVSLLKSNQIARILSYVSIKDDLRKGKTHYQKQCASCHNQMKSKVLQVAMTSQQQYIRKNIFHMSSHIMNKPSVSLNRQSWSEAIKYLLYKTQLSSAF